MTEYSQSTFFVIIGTRKIESLWRIRFNIWIKHLGKVCVEHTNTFKGFNIALLSNVHMI